MAADRSLSTAREDQARLAFEAGGSSFMLNYPFVWPSARVLTTADVSWADVTPGAILAGIGWTALLSLGGIPFAAACTDPCDGRTQGTRGMMDSLPYRNDAALVLGRLIRSLPTRRGVMGVATCDKGLPAMMQAVAAAMKCRPTRARAATTSPPTSSR